MTPATTAVASGRKWPWVSGCAAAAATMAAFAVATCAGCGNWAPLPSPLAPELRQTRAVRLAVAAADMPQIAETIRVVSGKSIELAAAPTKLVGGDHQLSAFNAALPVATMAAQWTAAGELEVVGHSAPLSIALAIGRSGEPACALAWTVKQATAKLRARTTTTATGKVEVTLAAAPELAVKHGIVPASEPCLAPLSAAGQDQVAQAVQLAIHAAWLPRLSAATLQALRTLAPVELAVGIRWSPHVAASGALDLEQRYFGELGASPASVVGKYAVFELALASNAVRDPCAVDVQAAPAPIAASLAPAPVPAAKAVLRRALVVHQSAIGLLVAAAARAGAYCRTVAEVQLTGTATNWASAVVPELAGWIDESPPLARLLPHSSPTTELIDSGVGPAIAWQFNDATLEIIGRVSGAQAVVFAVRGRLRGALVPTVNGNGQISLHLATGSMDSAVVSSPIVGGTVAAKAGPLEVLVRAAIVSIFSPDAVLPTTAALPAGTVVTDIARSADSLWIWLDGGLPSP
ncbi:MAG: hypothetical protein EXR77_01035 [Myxococcales bacterium]|nr:hypothetical protein [Myxococcales bacterium]